MNLKDRNLRPGQLVRHFKGGVYRILNVVTHTETGERLVIYKDARDPAAPPWARPEEMFCSEVDRDKYPDAQQCYRMQPIGEERKG